jgi:hypothetical protein
LKKSSIKIKKPTGCPVDKKSGFVSVDCVLELDSRPPNHHWHTTVFQPLKTKIDFVFNLTPIFTGKNNRPTLTLGSGIFKGSLETASGREGANGLLGNYDLFVVHDDTVSYFVSKVKEFFSKSRNFPKYFSGHHERNNVNDRKS